MDAAIRVRDDHPALGPGHRGAGLEARGHEATATSDGREGFERATSDCFDVVILDHMLPQLDGLSIVALMRAEGVSTPLLFLTNLSGILKPFAFEELMGG